MDEEMEVIEKKSELPTKEARQAIQKKFQAPMEDETASSKVVSVVFIFYKFMEFLTNYYTMDLSRVKFIT